MGMLRPEHVDQLRCPLDPDATRLEEGEGCLVCQRCRLKFPIREGIPSLLVSGAELPEGVRDVNDLPCQRRDSSDETHA
jgi:uncharacterized protein YbaR (Trm112 family)